MKKVYSRLKIKYVYEMKFIFAQPLNSIIHKIIFVPFRNLKVNNL